MDSSIVERLGEDDPQQIGRFPIIGLLGAGAMGKVYLGVGKEGYVAVKQVHARDVTPERFEQEVTVLLKVPMGVASRVLAHDSTGDPPWFATEYVPGLTLHDAVRVHSGPLPADVLRRLLSELISKLYEVHDKEIVHRDLKPANLMLVRDGVTLIDFGIARAADLPRLTIPGTGLGTPGFSAPEQEKDGATAAPSADVYSLGAVLFYAATGSAPNGNPDLAPLREKDPELASVVERCLARRPELRPTTTELVAEARDLVDDPDVPWPDAITEQIEARRVLEQTPVETIRAELASKARTPENELAHQVKRQWETEERVRRAHNPYRLPVRFNAAERDQLNQWARIHGLEPGEVAAPLDLAGDLKKITDVYRSIPSERLVVLGPAGSGKTILALRFVLDRLRVRATDDRVPVIFNLSSWDPEAVSLRDWMCRQIVRDYRTLGAAAEDGGTKAAALIKDDRILPVLDGFDEIVSGLRGPALNALETHVGPFLLTSRPDEYVKAVGKRTVLADAASIELDTLTPDEIAEYLAPSDQAAPTLWEPVLNVLRAQPGSDSVTAKFVDALATPLMVAMARTVYDDALDQDPAELLNADRFPDADSIQAHLLAEFVPASYRRPPTDTETSTASRPRRRHHWDAKRAERWLGYLAWHMREQNRSDLAWWELGTAMGPRSVMLVVGITVAVATGVVAGLVYGTAAAIDYGPALGLGMMVPVGVVNGLGVGLTFGLMHGFASRLKAGGPVFEPSCMQIQLQGGSWARLREGFAPRVGAGFVGGLFFGALWAGATSLYDLAALRIPPAAIAVTALDELALGLGLGLAIGLTAALGTGLEALSDQATATRPTALLGTNRINVLLQMAAVAVVIGVGYGAVLGPAPGLAAALMVPLGLGTMTAWGRWVVLVRIWLPLRRRAPWAMIAFLEDAYDRGVLRQAGAVYQLRHDKIQIQLADKFANARRIN